MNQNFSVVVISLKRQIDSISGSQRLPLVVVWGSDWPKPNFKPKPKYRNFGSVRTDTETETEKQSVPKPKPKPKPKEPNFQNNLILHIFFQNIIRILTNLQQNRIFSKFSGKNHGTDGKKEHFRWRVKIFGNFFSQL
jgi:hypothetical protein